MIWIRIKRKKVPVKLMKKNLKERKIERKKVDEGV